MTFGFQTPLDLRKTDATRWTVLNPLVYLMESGGSLTVPAGFSTDLASIPSLFWNLMPKTGEYDSAAVLHDFLYSQIMPAMDGACKHTVSKKFADSMFREAMTSLEVGRVRKELMVRAVMWFGRSAWRSHCTRG